MEVQTKTQDLPKYTETDKGVQQGQTIAVLLQDGGL